MKVFRYYLEKENKNIIFFIIKEVKYFFNDIKFLILKIS